MAASPGHRHDMFYLQSDIARTAVGASPIPLGQDILTYEIALQLALLIVDTLDVRGLHFLRVETRYLDVDLMYGQAGGHEAHSLDGCLRFRAQRGRQPAFRSATIGEAGLPVAGFPATATATILPSLGQCAADVAP